MNVDFETISALKWLAPSELVGAIEDIAEDILEVSEELKAVLAHAPDERLASELLSSGEFYVAKLSIVAILLEEVSTIPDFPTRRTSAISIRDVCSALGLRYADAVCCVSVTAELRAVLSIA